LAKAGRPPGSRETPHTLLRNELKATAFTLHKVRTFIEKQIAECEKLLQSKETTLAQRLEAIDILTSVTEKLAKLIDAAAKNLAPSRAGGSEQPDNDTQSADQIMKVLLGGHQQ
jgi:hypothetical protein